MDSAFFKSNWNQPSRARYSPAVRGVPVQTAQRKPTTTSSQKIVSIPVHFVGSEKTRSASALKIQKVFRAFLVRTSVKKILSIRSEVDEIERRLSKSETVELIRRDTKERLRINETLMALLFKLDSIRGVDSGVRDLRKAVIKKAVALQEKVDAIVAAPDQTLGTASVSDRAVVEVEVEVDVDGSNSIEEPVDQTQTLEINDSAEFLIDCENAGDEGAECQGKVECSFDCNNKSDQTLETENAVDENLDLGVSSESVPNSSRSEASDGEACVVKEIVECYANPHGFIEGGAEEQTSGHGLIEGGDEEQTSGKVGDGIEVQRPDRTEGNDRELLERMMGENGKMMRLMKQIFERNEMQTRMLTSLSQRVEQMEKAFICHKLRRKKRNANAM